MAKVFSVASWNVEHFRGDATRVKRVVNFLKDQKPDVFGLYEVVGSSIFSTLVTEMPNYTFQITEGPQTQEILVGVHKNITAFITQKVTFKAGTTHMRPGQLVTVVKNNKNYALLFLHLASGTNPRGMGLRDEMLERAFDFRKKLDKAEGGTGKSRYLFLGDLNTMGLKYPFKKNIDADTEIRKWDKYARRKKVKMRRLDKTHPFSWSNGSNSRYKPSSLDHVYASDNLKFKQFGGTNAEPQLVKVKGWVEEPTVAKEDKWIERFSDHSLLYLEVHD
jgi:exonuclease III